jgi:hypothetical protein
MRRARDVSDWLHNTGLVVRVHDGDDGSVGVSAALYVGNLHAALARYTNR